MPLSNLPRLATNIVSLLSSDAMNRASTFIIYALIARYLGAHAFGQLSLALTLFYAFQVLAAAGLKVLVTREVAKARAETGRYLVNGCLVATGSSVLAVAVLLLFVYLMGYAPDTAAVIVLLALGLLPFALTAVFEAIFQAWERMYYIMLVGVPVNVARISLAYLALQRGYGVQVVVGMLMASYAVVAVVECVLARHLLGGHFGRPDPAFARTLVKATTTFLGIDVLIAISASLNVVLLSKLADETQVGIYSAALQVLVPVGLFIQNAVLGIFPRMCRQMTVGFQGMKRSAEQAIALLLALVLPVAVGLYVLADQVLQLLYANRDLVGAWALLRIAVWGQIALALTTVLGYVLFAAGRERWTLRLVGAQLVGDFVLGFVLISQLGVVGAVVVALLDRLVGLAGHYLLVARRVGRVGLVGVAWRPILASACMAGCLAVVSASGLVVTILAGGLVYIGVLLVLTVWSFGGPAQLRAAFLRQSAE
jgi:O-antigen/teichoic acid export membrane protein